MSFLTGSVVENIYASTAAGATLSTFTTEAQLNTTGTMGVLPHLVPDFWLPRPGDVGRAIKVVARGVLSTTSSAPTYNFILRGGAAGNITTNPLFASTGTFTPAVSLTNVAWQWEIDLVLSAIGAAGANSTLRGEGLMVVGGIAASAWPVWGGGSSPGTVATLDTSIANYLNFNVACGTSNASNAVTLNQLLVYGLN